MATDEAPRANEFGPPSPERREFLTRLSIGLSAVIGAVIGLPIVGFLLAPLFQRPEEAWRPVEPASDLEAFRIGETVQVTILDPSPLAWAGLAARTSVWLRREAPREFKAFAVNCTHLGCPVRWLADARLFMCPCHGGVFYEDGRVAAGPPQEPLVQYPVRVQDGVVQILAGASPLVSE